MAKSSKDVLTKKDFSILETMSRRIEELSVKLFIFFYKFFQGLNENLKMNINNMGMDNDILSKRLEKIENLFLNTIKNDLLDNNLIKDDIVNSLG